MIEIVGFRAHHLEALELGPTQAELQLELEAPGYGALHEVAGWSWTGLIDGRIVGCAGIFPLSAHRGLAWALLGEMPRRAWPEVTRIVGLEIASAHHKGMRRIEATIRRARPAAKRWMERLGFELETPGGMPGYAGDGATHFLYAHIDWPRLRATLEESVERRAMFDEVAA